jgi:hypothetical protein
VPIERAQIDRADLAACRAGEAQPRNAGCDRGADRWVEPEGTPARLPCVASASQMASMNPLQIYMQFAEQWQKACADAMAYWGQRRAP